MLRSTPLHNNPTMRHCLPFLAFTFVCSIAADNVTWIDNEHGNVISFDGDQGWKIWECPGNNYCDSMVSFCDDESDCRREDVARKVYYGPFNNDIDDSKWMMRRFECEESSDVSIQLQVSSCNADGTKNEDDLTLWIAGSKLGKYAIDSTSGVLLDDAGTLSKDDCSSYFTQTIAPEDGVSVDGHSRFEVRFRHRTQEHSEAYIHDIEIQCAPDGRHSEADESPEATHEHYCVSGFEEDLEFMNGEYALFMDTEDHLILDANGYAYFAKHDVNGEAFLYLHDGSTWVIGETLNGGDFVFGCNQTVDDVVGHEYFRGIADLECDDEVSLVEGECEDHHTTISDMIHGVVIEYEEAVEGYMWTHPLNVLMIGLFVSVFVCMCAISCVMCFKMKSGESYGKMVTFEESASDDTEFDDDEEPLSAI